MTQLVFLLEEPSARELLRGLLPRILPASVSVHYLVFEGKQDLEAQLPRKLRSWRAPDTAFVVLRDQDASDCRAVKRRLADLVAASGRAPVLVRVACRELESWVVGDLRAVAEVFGRPALAELSTKEKYREPDALVRPVEALRQLVPEYQKVDGARRLGPLLDPVNNTSPSFSAFCQGVRRMIEGAA